MGNLAPSLGLKDQLLSAGLTLPAGATTVISSAIDLGIGPYSGFDPQRLEFRIEVPALLATQIAASQYIGFGAFTSAYTSGASALPYVQATPVASGQTNGPGGIMPQAPTANTAGTSGGSSYVVTFKLPTFVPQRFLFVTATGGTSTAANSVVANVYVAV